MTSCTKSRMSRLRCLLRFRSMAGAKMILPPGYFYCDIPIAGLLATDIVDVTVLPEFYDVAGAVGFIATESLEGKLRLRAAKAPTEKISAQYHITSTVKYTDAQEGGT